jgi:flagellar hook-associated protein 2
MATVNASSSSPPISSPGIGSGLDINGIVTKLVALEKQPLTRLQRDAGVLQGKMSSVGQIKSQMSSLSDALTNLASITGWNNLSVTPANDVSFQVGVSGSAALGSYAVQVQQLAKAQSTISTVFSAPLPSGRLTVDVGMVKQGVFTPGNSAVTIDLTQDDDTLDKIAGKINASNAGVTASVLSDVNGQRLMLRSNATGEDQVFRIQTGPGLEVLSFDPAASSTRASQSAMGLSQAGQHAQASINGVQVSSSTNTYEGGLAGLSFQFKQVSASAVDITVGQDTSTVKNAINDMVKAYNTLTSNFVSLVKYDAATKTSGPFQGDSTITALQFALRRLISAPGPDGKRISDMGIKFQSDGTLMVDEAKVSNMLASQWTASKNFYTHSTLGFAVKLKSFADGILSTKGALSSKSDSLQKLLNKNTNDQSSVNDRAARVESDLRRQYNALDSKLGELNALSSYVTQQVNAWSNAKSQ